MSGFGRFRSWSEGADLGSRSQGAPSSSGPAGFDSLSILSKEEEEDKLSGDEFGGRYARWRERGRGLHRHERGSAQLKPIRTLKWLKESVETGAAAIVAKASHKQQRPEVEKEGISGL